MVLVNVADSSVCKTSSFHGFGVKKDLDEVLDLEERGASGCWFMNVSEAMAATTSAWAKPGAWALDFEEHKAELLWQKEEDDAGVSVSSQPLSDFPSLAITAGSKLKKKKGQTVSLAEFSTYGGPKPPQASYSDGLTHEDLMTLSTGLMNELYTSKWHLQPWITSVMMLLRTV